MSLLVSLGSRADPQQQDPRPKQHWERARLPEVPTSLSAGKTTTAAQRNPNLQDTGTEEQHGTGAFWFLFASQS